MSYVYCGCFLPMEGMGRLQFSDLFTELPISPHATGVVVIFECVLYIVYIILNTLASFLDHKDAILFLRCLLLIVVMMGRWSDHSAC